MANLTLRVKEHVPKQVKLNLIIKKELYVLIIIILISFIVRLIAIGSADLIAEEAYYWNYSNHLDFSYLDHPPMVALLIKIFTLLFGTNEFGVRFASLVCWLVCVIFSYKLTELIKPQAGKNAVLLLAILPFFFVHSLVMTPDLPLIACWSASLYYLYLALVCNKSQAWYYAGIWIGLGMISKYTILLLGPTTLIYLLTVRDARQWFFSRAPYVCILITISIFSPVIYWNATHEWVSFLFQSTRRLNATDNFSFHELLGLLILFLTPLGMLGFYQLFKQKAESERMLDFKTQRFLQLFTLIPLAIFSVFSLAHGVKFNWIGPGLLAIIPWLALQMSSTNQATLHKGWLLTGMLLLVFYISMLCCMGSGMPEIAYRTFLTKFIDWNDFNQQVHRIARSTEKQFNAAVLVIPLDRYNIASELAFYQAKSVSQGKMTHPYPIIGSDIFGYESLMYRYWSKGENFTDKTIILISVEARALNEIKDQIVVMSPPKTFWAHSQGNGANITPYYYQTVKLKNV